MPATAAIARNGHSDRRARERHDDEQQRDRDVQHERRRGHRPPRQPVCDLSRRQREQRQRQELHQPDEAEVERVVVDRVDLPADRDREHLEGEAVREERRPEEREVPDPQRGRKASLHPWEVRLRRMADAHETTQAKLEWLRELRDKALHAGSERAVQKRQDEGRLLARERAEKLCDPGSFVELDRYVRHRESNFGMMDRRPYGDAVVTGYGTVFGRKVFVFSQDFTVFGGSLSEVFAEKICKVMDLAVKYGCPVIGINDSGGARIQEGVVSLAGYAEIFWRNVQASGVVPQISLVMGPCAGGAVYSPAITDFIFMVEGSSYMFITGPDVVKTVTGEEVTFEELGGAATHAAKSGVAQFTAADEEACLEDARYLLSFLPQNNVDRLPRTTATDPSDREDAELDTLIPDNANKPYDMHDVIRRVIDDGEFLEVHERWAGNIVCGFARLGGTAVGVVGNQPSVLAGVLDIDASNKAARFVRTCDAFNIPLVTFVDVPGLPAGHRAGVGRDHPSRREAAVRVRGGDGAEAHGDHAQGVRRRVRRHELEAHPRRLQLRVADRGGRRDGPRGRGQHRLPPRARRREGCGGAQGGADRGLQGALRESVHRRGARLRRRRDRAEADAPGADRRARDRAHEGRAPAEAQAREHPALARLLSRSHRGLTRALMRLG